MILSKQELDQIMSEEEQNRKIEKIKNSPEGKVLFVTHMNDKRQSDVTETLFAMANSDYHECVFYSCKKIKWAKGNVGIFNFDD
jgi:DNA polymerase III delta subunit